MSHPMSPHPTSHPTPPQAEAAEAAVRSVRDQLSAVAAGAVRAQAEGQRLRRALEDIGDGTAATVCHVAALRVRLRWDLTVPYGAP